MFVRGQIVQDDYVATLQGWEQHGPYVRLEDVRGGGTFQGHTGALPVQSERSDHGGGSPVATGSAVIDSFAAERAAPQAGHVGLGTRFIQKDQLLRIEVQTGKLPEFTGYD